jgi:hypothetical protein
MNLPELMHRFKEAGVRQDAYSFEPSTANEQYCLARIGSAWVTYYAERGGRTSMREFETEEEACSFFFAWVTNDPSAQSLVNAHGVQRDA